MSVSLTKGARVNLTKDTGLKKAMLGLGWDINRYDSGDFDLDLVMFECDANKRCLDDHHMVFYGNLHDPEEAVKHSGDNRTGAGDGDDETAFLDFDKINPNVESIIIAVTIYEARAKNQNFGCVDNAFIRMVDTDTNEEVLRFDLGEDFSTEKSVVFAEIYKASGEWKFKAVGQGYDKELVDFCHEYGIDVA